MVIFILAWSDFSIVKKHFQFSNGSESKPSTIYTFKRGKCDFHHNPIITTRYLELEIIILSNSMYLYYLSSYIRSFDVTSSSVVIQILVLLELLLFCSWIPRRSEYNSYFSYEFSYLFFLKNHVTTMRESLASKPVISSLLRNVVSFFFKKDDSRCLTSQNLPEFQARDHLT